MLGFSLQKIFFTALAVAVVWYGFKWFSRWRVGQQDKNQGHKAGRGSEHDIEEMVKCSGCGDYVSAQSRACGQPNCPFP